MSHGDFLDLFMSQTGKKNWLFGPSLHINLKAPAYRLCRHLGVGVKHTLTLRSCCTRSHCPRLAPPFLPGDSRSGPRWPPLSLLRGQSAVDCSGSCQANLWVNRRRSLAGIKQTSRRVLLLLHSLQSDNGRRHTGTRNITKHPGEPALLASSL